MPVPIPPAFLARMQHLLKAGYPAFLAALAGPSRTGLRVNTLKLAPEAFAEIAPFRLGERVPWCPSAFNLAPPSPALSPGTHPYHLAGLYYLQDPSAMAPGELLMGGESTQGEGLRVLDLAAAPGGKTTHLAALMNGRGLLVANEIKDKRVGHLAQNVERWGAGNVAVTNETPERLADHFGAWFDRVLVDAPCSGEGMFRKDMSARADWSPEMVAGCAVRQVNILRVAARLVRPGGRLLYSTCTFAPEEDEGVIARFLEERPDFAVVPLPQYPGFMEGRPDWVPLTAKTAERAKKNQKDFATFAPFAVQDSLRGAVRLFPHLIDGEGHFACLLERREGDDDGHVDDDRLLHPTKDQFALWEGFARGIAPWRDDRLRLVRERLYLVPDPLPDLGRLRVVHPGVWLGTFKKDRIEPAHPLALHLKADQFDNVLSLKSDGREIAAYLRGETLASDGPPGWTLVAMDGHPLGWGKRVGGVVKNHFPRGWIVSWARGTPRSYDI